MESSATTMSCITPGVIRQCRAMKYPPSTDEEILHSFRTSQEYRHRHYATWMNIISPLNLSNTLPIPQANYPHLQDCCNKSIAIYQNGPSDPSHIYNEIYKQWFRGHQTYLDFATFLAKIVMLHRLGGPPETLTDIVRMHHELCDQVVAFQEMLDRHDGTKLDSGGMFDWGLNWKQRSCYRLRQLFRALIIIVNGELVDGDSDQTVRLVLTGVTDGLSAPITFESIPENNRQPDPHHHGAVLTPLQAAIRFVIKLERRERYAQSDQDRKVLDESEIYGFPRINDNAQRRSYTGGPIHEPSNTWVYCPGYVPVIPGDPPKPIRSGPSAKSTTDSPQR